MLERREIFPGAVLLDNRVFYFAVVMSTDAEIEGAEEIFRRLPDPPIYSQFEELTRAISQVGGHEEGGVFDVIDLDAALYATRHRMRPYFASDVVLTAWNGLSDLLPAAGYPFHFDGHVADGVYEKLFREMNYVSPRLHGGFAPAWNRSELSKLRVIIERGSDRVRKLVGPCAVEAGLRGSLWSEHELLSDSLNARIDLLHDA